MTSDFTGASYSEQPALLSRHHRGTTCFLSTSSVHCCKRFDICLFSPPCSFEGNYVPGYASSGFLATSGMFASRIVFLPSRKRKIIVDIGTFFANATLRTASQHSTPQYSRAQHSTAQHSIAQHSTARPVPLKCIERKTGGTSGDEVLALAPPLENLARVHKNRLKTSHRKRNKKAHTQ